MLQKRELRVVELLQDLPQVVPEVLLPLEQERVEQEE